MERIASFTVDHTRLLPGLYVSRVDRSGSFSVTTFDIRMKKPNTGDVLSTAAAHAIEHLGATFLRNDKRVSESTVYFGPMGCRTGFYVIFFGALNVSDVSQVIGDMFEFIAGFEGKVPGASEAECGNFRDISLSEAKKEAGSYLKVLRNLSKENTLYPQ